MGSWRALGNSHSFGLTSLSHQRSSTASAHRTLCSKSLQSRLKDPLQASGDGVDILSMGWAPRRQTCSDIRCRLRAYSQLAEAVTLLMYRSQKSADLPHPLRESVKSPLTGILLRLESRNVVVTRIYVEIQWGLIDESARLASP